MEPKAKERSFNFESVGGRLKLVTEATAPVSLLKGDIVVAEVHKRLKLQKAQAAEERQRRSREAYLLQHKTHLVDWLRSNHFNIGDVNAQGMFQPGSCFSFSFFKTYLCQPLHKAVKDHNQPIIELLLQFGADPLVKDSRGKTAYYYASCDMQRTRMHTLRRRYESEGGVSLGWLSNSWWAFIDTLAGYWPTVPTLKL